MTARPVDAAPTPRPDRRPPHACHLTGAAHTLTTAGPQDVDDLADLLTEGFTGYPWTDWLVPADDRPARLRALVRADLAHVGLPYGTVWTVRCPGSERPVGAVVVLRPDVPVPDAAWGQVRAVEVDALGPRLTAAEQADALLAGLRSQGPAVVLATMAVTPDHRRRGLAKRLVDHATRLADRLRVPTCLETSTAGNVALYRGAGFEVTGHVLAPDGPDVWAMRREPR